LNTGSFTEVRQRGFAGEVTGGRVVISSRRKGKPVNSIASWAFNNQPEITSVKIAKNVINLKDIHSAFVRD